VDERPLTMVGLAFGGGFLLSAFVSAVSSRPGSRRPSSDDYRAYQEPSHSSMWEIVREAAVGLAAARLKELVDELVPGFQEEYRKAEAARVKQG
jgi:hypothetical protein